MNGKFDKKKILKQMEKNRKGARKLVADSIKDAKKILKNEGLLGHESSPLAVVKLAEALFKIEASVLQGKAKVEQAGIMIKAKLEAEKKAKTEAAKKARSCEECQARTPVA